MDKKRITLEEFRNKALHKQKNRKKVAYINVDGFGEIQFTRPTDDEVMTYMNDNANAIRTDEDGNIVGQDMVKMVNASKELVYSCCAYLKDSELRESLEIKDPHEMPVKVFGINGTMMVAKEIIEKFGGLDIGNEAEEDIKN